ncbi:MAG TPA: ABC-F family ATP-binding cassette domain-containing protein [Beijerinckiaceae bacterium]|nr:ABC-F family ATP-binding cassette domain-containing protein [Beijerinckiaceae bacterium]
MPVVIQCQDISKTYGARPLFQSLSLSVSDGERIGIVGPNGAGKSTLLRILSGAEPPDSGEVSVRKLARVRYVPQEPEFPPGLTVRGVLESALGEARLSDGDGETRIHLALGRAGFTGFDAAASELSGGRRKRLAIARELVHAPDVLLLDEPTNHLDIEGIAWLERLLADAAFACVAVSHDRYFLENVATDMVEIDRRYPEGAFRVRGAYSEFLLKREEYLSAASKRQESLENKVRREVEWLRRGPKARTGKSRARIDSANQLIGELAAASERSARASAQIDFTASERKTKRLIGAVGVAKSLGGRSLFRDVTFSLGPGARLGLVGPNGSGKTTLLRLLAGELQPDAGEIERADGLRVVYFDQHREQLDTSVSLKTALCPHGDSVIYRDRPIHVAGWARRFLFRVEQLEMPVSRLSGGERARVLIARLMLQPADVLLLDEPTNDLDIPTLEVLEDSLLEFPGAIALVTHDRHMLDRVANVVLGIDGEGESALVADYAQWEQARQESRTREVRAAAPPPAASAPARKRLSYLEQREWDGIEVRIEEADRALAAAHSQLHDPETMRDPRRLQEAYAAVEAAQAAADALYARWAELDAKVT